MLICGIKNAIKRKIMKSLSKYNLIRRLFFLLSLFIIISSIFVSKILIFEWNLELLTSSSLNFSIILDKFALFFSSTVLFISANVLLFSNSYMRDEKENNRFLIIILLFILSINLLIFIPNLIFLLLGWDGLGLVRFLLVIHYNSPKSLAAGYITVLTNRIGDVMILIRIPILFSTITWTPSTFIPQRELTLLALIIIVAGITKSAQLPFSRWLPAAIAAPTPISALVHSSTLVTAGVYLLFRFYPILSLSPIFNSSLLFRSALTILIRGLIAFKETDIKKIIALSTLRQLGVMIFRLRINLPTLTFFHLLTHATFKALLFIGAGNIILQISHSQDLRHFGNLLKLFPLTVATISIANLSLSGFPFLAGFFSKDLIIEISILRNINLFSFIILFIATLLTLAYSLRFTYFLFLRNSLHSPLISPSNKDKNINLAYFIMGVYVIFSGALINWRLIFPYPHPNLLEFLKFLILPSLLFIVISLMVIVFVNNLSPKTKISKSPFSFSMWFLNFLSSHLFLKTFNNFGKLFYQKIDNNWIEIFMGRGLKNYVIASSSNLTHWQTFYISSNFSIVIICIIILFYFNSLIKALFWRNKNGLALKYVFVV